MNSMWVGRTTHPKKRLACEISNRKDWKSEKWEEDFKTDEDRLQHCWKDQIRPRKTGPLPFTLLHTRTLTVQTQKSRNPDLQSVCFENKWSDEELLDKLTQPSYRMTGILHDVLHAVLPHLCLPDKNLLQYKNRLLSGAMALVAHLDHCQYSVSYMSILFSFTSGFF